MAGIARFGSVIETGMVMPVWRAGMSFASRTKRPSVENGGLPTWNCGMSIVPVRWQKPSSVSASAAMARFVIAG